MSHTPIDAQRVRHVAKLAKLALEDHEVASLQRDLNSILGYIEKLDELDVSGVQATSHPIPLALTLREDVVVKTLTHDEVLQNAPDHETGMFRVPRIVEGGN